MTTAVEKRNTELAKNAWDLLKGMKAGIAAILPKHLTPERMAMIAFTAMRQNPKLLECSRESIIGSIMTASILGLEPSGPLGHGALIPYKGECQFQPMYQGLLELARRSGLIKDVQLRAVYKGDTYKFRFGLDPTIEHIPMEGPGVDSPDRECTHVYCIIRFTNGGLQWEQLSFAEAMAHGKRFSKTWDRENQQFRADTPWQVHPVPMAMKTVLKRTLKLCPKSPEMAMAMSIDDLGDEGRMATLKQMEDGVFDVDFGGSIEEVPAQKEEKTGTLDKLVTAAKKPKAETTAPEPPKPTEKRPTEQPATKTGVPDGWQEREEAEPIVDRFCTIEEFEEITLAAYEHALTMKEVKKHVADTMGIPTYDALPYSRLGEVMAWIASKGRTRK